MAKRERRAINERVTLFNSTVAGPDGQEMLLILYNRFEMVKDEIKCAAPLEGRGGGHSFMKRFIESTKSRTDNLRRSVSRCFLLCLLITAFFGGCMFRPLLEKRKTETVPSVRTQDLTRPSVRTAPSKVPRSTEPSAKTAPSRVPRLTESTTKASEVSEATKRSKPVDLYAVWENHLRSVQEIEMVFLKEDFDGDGVAEAFGITGKPYMNYCRQYAGENVKIYFISAAGEVSLVRDQTDWGEPIYGYLNTGDLLELAESPGRLTYEAGSEVFHLGAGCRWQWQCEYRHGRKKRQAI